MLALAMDVVLEHAYCNRYGHPNPKIVEDRVDNRYCSVPQCKNKSKNNVSLHRFPTEPLRCAEWAKACRIEKKISKYMFVCSAHFLPENYFFFHLATKSRKLKKNAIPSCKLPILLPKKGTTEKRKVATAARPNSLRKRLSDRNHCRGELGESKEDIGTRHFDAQEITERCCAEVCNTILSETCSDPLKQDCKQEAIEGLLQLGSLSGEQELIKEEPKDRALLIDASTQCPTEPLSEVNLIKKEPAARALLIDASTQCHAESFSRINDSDLNTEIQKNQKQKELEVKALRKEASTQCHRELFSVINLIKNDSDLNAVTGINSMLLLRSLSDALELQERYSSINKLFQLDVTERIVLTLMKLKLDISFKCISVMFGISITSCIRYFNGTIPLLSVVLQEAEEWPSKRDTMKAMMQFPEARVMLDCTETPDVSPV